MKEISGHKLVKEVHSHKLEEEKPESGAVHYYKCTICGLTTYMEIDGEWRVSARSAQQQPLEDMSCEDFIIREIIE